MSSQFVFVLKIKIKHAFTRWTGKVKMGNRQSEILHNEMNYPTVTLQNWNKNAISYWNATLSHQRSQMWSDLYMRCHLWSSARPPTEASWMCGASENSVQSLLQLLHGKCPQSLGGWIWFEHARLLGEGVDALLCWSSGLLLQLQHACKFEVSVLLDFVGCHAKERFDDTLHLLVLVRHLGAFTMNKHTLW